MLKKILPSFCLITVIVSIASPSFSLPIEPRRERKNISQGTHSHHRHDPYRELSIKLYTFLAMGAQNTLTPPATHKVGALLKISKKQCGEYPCCPNTKLGRLYRVSSMRAMENMYYFSGPKREKPSLFNSISEKNSAPNHAKRSNKRFQKLFKQPQQSKNFKTHFTQRNRYPGRY